MMLGGLAFTPITFLLGLPAAWHGLVTQGLGAAWLLTFGWTTAASAALTVFALYLIPLFVRRSRRVPQLVVRYVVANIVFNAVVAALVVASGEPTPKQAIAGIVIAFAWIAYFRSSPIVQSTFTYD
jgi:hypothetical protein